jgi:hypothetical protein
VGKHLRGDRILAEAVTENLNVDRLHVVVVCPQANDDHRHMASTTMPIGRRWPDRETVIDAIRSLLKVSRHLGMVAQGPGGRRSLGSVVRAGLEGPSPIPIGSP